MPCYDPKCTRPVTHELRGFPMCAEHYIEALEHGAHLNFGQWNGKDQRTYLPKVIDQVLMSRAMREQKEMYDARHN